MSNFEDNSAQVKSMLQSYSTEGAIEAAKLIVDAAKSNSRVDSGETRDAYTYTESSNSGGEIEITVGNPLENAIYEEFGTGEYAENGNGRKGGWWFYHEGEGEWRFTHGKKPNPVMRDAYRNNKDSVRNAVISKFTG